jgi:hypothetical protein
MGGPTTANRHFGYYKLNRVSTNERDIELEIAPRFLRKV